MKILWKASMALVAITGVGAIIETVFPLPGPGWMEDMFDIFEDDDAEL